MLKNRLNALYKNITQLESQFGRLPHSVHLLAISKTQSIESIRQVWENGQIAFGENYLQEALPKIAALHDIHIEWHFIGPIQANKTRLIAENFSWVQSIERLKIAERLNTQRPSHLPPLNVCIQVNISQESSKSGIIPEEVISLAKAIQSLPQLKLRGLMAIPEPLTDFQQQRKAFHQLHRLFTELNKTLSLSLDTLSMGMSQDYAAAIAEGSTMIRIGTALFGERIR